MKVFRQFKGVLAAALALVMLVCAAAVIPAVASAQDGAPAPTASSDRSAGKAALAIHGITEVSANPGENIAGIDKVLSSAAADGGSPADGEDAVPAAPADSSLAPAEPGKLLQITRTDSAEDAIALTWNTAEGTQGYRVYWRNSDDRKSGYSLLTVVRDTSLIVRGLKKGAMYDFRITACRISGGELIDGESAEITAGTMPDGVTDLRLASCVPESTVLKWNKNSLCDGYVLYRQDDGVWSRYAELPCDTPEFTDTAVFAGKSYNYRVCAVRTDSSGTLESPPAELRTVSGLCAPADNGTAALLRRVHLKWKKNAYADGYEIRWSLDKLSFSVLCDTADTSYTTDPLTDGQHYYFRVVPYRYDDADGQQVKVYGTYMAWDATASNTAYGKEVPATYIEVSIDQQHMWYYIDGELFIDTDVVTGNYLSMDTPKGYWKVNSKASPCTLVGANYVSYVNYWMAFIGGAYGIHDASWRSTYGGTIYKGGGSHGCINTPYAAVKEMYAKVTIGTPVIVY